MPIANNVDNYLVGSQQVDRIYQGANIVWERFNGLLDLYPNAAVAYSLRRLSKNYAGSAIRVRRGSDNAEQDIGFVDNELDTASLLSFIGAGDGFITTWYDQSGFNRDAIQTTATNQPLIALNGVIYTVNSKPALFNNTKRTMIIPNASNVFKNTGYGMLIALSMRTQVNLQTHIFSWTTNINTASRFALRQQNNVYTIQSRRLDSVIDSGIINSKIIAINTQVLQIGVAKWSEAKLFQYINGNLDGSLDPFLTAGNTSDTNSAVASIGSFSGSLNYFIGNYQECIAYNTNQDSNRIGIESNINDYYGIY